MKTVCKLNLCNGCNACVSICPKNAIELEDCFEHMNAIINESLCVNCNACINVCSRNDFDLVFSKPLLWYQGWTSDELVRQYSASGGVASTLMKSFIEAEGYVCSCIFDQGRFSYAITNNVSEIHKFSGSKYVKSYPRNIYHDVKKLLDDNRPVLFVGLPCHVAAVKKYIGYRNQDLLYTVDLICHGTPSAKILSKYLEDHGCSVDDILDIKFRIKSNIDNDEYEAIVPPGITDRYLYTFLRKINLTESCYNCQFAQTERISDITIGDSWGSELPDSEKEKGISLLIVQTKKGKKLIEQADLVLFNVDSNKAIENNSQLRGAADRPKERNKFMKLIKKNKKYDGIVFKLAPKVFVKQDIKWMLYKFCGKRNAGITYTMMVKKVGESTRKR